MSREHIIWIGYPGVKELHSKMNDLLNNSKSHRPKSILLVGDSNNGKSLALKKFRDDNPSYLTDDKELIIPVLYVEAPPEPVEKRFYDEILGAMNAPVKPNEKAEVKFHRIQHLLKTTKVKVLIIDEIHNLTAGSPMKQRVFLNILKYLSNVYDISFVCAGIREALNVFGSDSQLSNRFAPYELRKWVMSPDFQRLLLSFEKRLNVNPEVSFINKEITQKVLVMSDGLIGEVSEIMNLYYKFIEENNLKDPDVEILDRIDYYPPDIRYKVFRHKL